MIFARSICEDSHSDLELAFLRLGLPTAAGEYAREKIPHYQILLTGLDKNEQRFLKSLFEQSTAPGREEFPTFIPGDERRRPGTALLSGRREQFRRLVVAARSSGNLAGLASAIDPLIEGPVPLVPLVLGSRRLEFGQGTHVMGILNVTPDSFSDGGHFVDPRAAVAHGEALAAAGASIVDVGGESTRPGAAPITDQQEMDRVTPVIEALHRRLPELPISIDTTKSAVAAAALDAGAVMVNDVSGLSFDPQLAGLVASRGAACCVMHLLETPATMQHDPRYDDLVQQVHFFLTAAVARAMAAGVPKSHLVIDPGIGFGKTAAHNLFLLRRLRDFRSIGAPVLVGTSRKSFLGKLTGGKPADQRLAATIGSIAAVSGADIVRVHDVAEVKDALAVSDALRQACEGGSGFAQR